MPRSNPRLASSLISAALMLGALLTGSPGCSSDDAPAPAPMASDPGQVTQVIGVAGGTVTTPDGNASVTIPPGALIDDTPITISTNPTAMPPSATSVVGAAYTFGPDGLEFLKPITVALVFDPTRLAAGQIADSIVIFTAPDVSPTYTALPTSVQDSTHVIATTTHFCTDIPAVPAPSSAVDGGPSDAGILPVPETCVVSCGGGAAADAGVGVGDGGAALDAGPASVTCNCFASCNGHSYGMACTDGACTCSEDGSLTSTPSDPGMCSSALFTYNIACGFPGSLGSPVDAGTSADASAGADGGSAPPGDAGTD